MLAFLLAVSASAAPLPTAATDYVRPALAAPASGALLPWTRIVSYYGNPLSKRMGILGEIPPKEMMDRLEEVAREWRKADPATPVKPALELVAVVAQAEAGPDGLYRTRMPAALVEKVIGWAESRGWLVILDVQVGRGSSAEEIRRLEPWLSRPDVHLALDPEFDMPPGVRPGKRIGTSDADDVNDAVKYLADLSLRKKLPPKLLVVHRFVPAMLTGASRVKLDPRVQVAVVMDGFGSPEGKKRVYRLCVTREPIQHAGIKLFYKNDQPLMSPAELLRLTPIPQVIIYQ